MATERRSPWGRSSGSPNINIAPRRAVDNYVEKCVDNAPGATCPQIIHIAIHIDRRANWRGGIGMADLSTLSTPLLLL